MNTNSFPRKDLHKRDKLQELLTQNELDVIGLVELNTHWPSVPVQDRLYERTSKWWSERSLISAYNIHQCKKEYQPGGTALINTHKMVGRTCEMGRDISGLGRWVWSLYRGKNNIRVRVLVLYFPPKPSDPGSHTVYTQQKQYLRQSGVNTCPRDQLLCDLTTVLQKWISDGEQVIVMADTNEDISSPPSKGLVDTLRKLSFR